VHLPHFDPFLGRKKFKKQQSVDSIRHCIADFCPKDAAGS
jgi:hypothetical protein